MKLSVILLIAGFLQASAKTNAQNVTLSGKDIPLEQVFKRIQSQTPYVFFYDAGLLKSSHPVTLNLKNVSVKEALAEVFENQPLTFRMVATTITIVKKEDVHSDQVNALVELQKLQVKGIVTDAGGKPLEGVSVIIKGTKVGTSTGKDGSYSINVDNDNAVLVLSMVGFTTEEAQ